MTSISKVEPIEMGGINIESREDLVHFVEPPLLEACQVLFDKGIRTVFSSANKKDVGRNGHIAIDFESLTLTNRKIAQRIGKEGIIHGSKATKGIYLEFPISETSTVGEIKESVLAIVNQFENQNIES